jgi:hypothetical protein
VRIVPVLLFWHLAYFLSWGAELWTLPVETCAPGMRNSAIQRLDKVGLGCSAQSYWYGEAEYIVRPGIFSALIPSTLAWACEAVPVMAQIPREYLQLYFIVLPPPFPRALRLHNPATDLSQD